MTHVHQHLHHTIHRFCIALAVLTAAVMTLPAAGGGLIVITNPPDMPNWRHRFAPLEVREHHVTVSITDQLAVTEIKQVFYNPHQQQLEGTFIFPIPKGANIDNFSMDINGEMVEAELLDADKARKIYTDIVRSMRDPALMEYVGQSLLKVRIFPIEGRKEKKINLKYTQLLSKDSGMVDYRYSLNTDKFSSAPIKSLSVKINVQGSNPISTLYCPSHEVEITRADEHHATISFEQTNIRPDRDFQLFYGLDDSASSGLGFSVLTYRPQSGEPGYFMMLAAPSMNRTEQQILPKDIVFVLDTSGSMAGKKLEQAREALNFCLANLNKHDRFNIVRFSTEAESLFDTLTTVSDENIDKATTFIDSFQARGGTDIASALAAALDVDNSGDDRPFMIIFLTDGKPTVGTTDAQAIVDATAKKLGDRSIRIYSFGIGTNINTHLLDTIAQKTRATTEYVLPDEDIEIKVSNFYTKVDSPVLANPSLSVQGPVTFSAMQPRDLPDVFKGEQIVVFGRYNGAGDAAISIDGNLAGTQRTLVYESSFAPHEPNNEFIAQLWATRRVGWLLDQIRLHGENAELKDEVTMLARNFGIVTPYTSYLILEDDSMPMAFRTAQNMDIDRAMSEGRESYGRMRREVSGDSAVQASRKSRQMSQGGGGFGGGGGAPVPASETADMLGLVVGQDGNAGNPVRFVNGRTFYYNGEAWIDSTIDDDSQTEPVHIDPYSDEYFQLLDDHPSAAEWLALGDNIQLRLGDTLYIIAEKTE